MLKLPHSPPFSSHFAHFWYFATFVSRIQNPLTRPHHAGWREFSQSNDGKQPHLRFDRGGGSVRLFFFWLIFRVRRSSSLGQWCFSKPPSLSTNEEIDNFQLAGDALDTNGTPENFFGQSQFVGNEFAVWDFGNYGNSFPVEPVGMGFPPLFDQTQVPHVFTESQLDFNNFTDFSLQPFAGIHQPDENLTNNFNELHDFNLQPAALIQQPEVQFSFNNFDNFHNLNVQQAPQHPNNYQLNSELQPATPHSNDHQVDSTVQPIICNYIGCSKTFTRQPDLLRHMRSVHGPASHACPISVALKILGRLTLALINWRSIFGESMRIWGLRGEVEGEWGVVRKDW